MLASKVALILGLSHQCWYHYPMMVQAWRNYATPLLKSTGLKRVVPFVR